MLVSTTEKYFKVKENKGIVKGVSIYAEKYFDTISTILKTKTGGPLDKFASLTEGAIKDATSKMIREAETTGANAIIGVKINTEVFMSGGNDNISAVTVYGTAVVYEA